MLDGPLALAQTRATVKSPPRGNLLQRTHFRAGLLLQRDHESKLYTLKDIDIVPVYRRTHLLSGTLGWAPFPKVQELRANFRVAYGNLDFNGDNADIGHNRFGKAFRENVRYRHLQLAGGLRIEAKPQAPLTTYFELHYLLSVPLQLDYELFRAVDPVRELPDYAGIKGGGQLSPGVEAGVGLRKIIAQYLIMNLGVYYTDQDIMTNWAALPNREFKEDTILRTKTFGVAVAVAYQW